MKKFTKLFLSLAAVSVVTAAVATSAMAAEKTLTATYATDEGGATGTVSINCDSQDETKTLLILKPGSDRTAVQAANILQIDQAASIVSAKVPALDENNEADKGTYTVLMGGTSGDIYVGTFSIGGEPITLGDVNGDNTANSTDAMAILFYEVGQTGRAANAGRDLTISDLGTLVASTFPKSTKLGDVNGDATANSTDAMAILFHEVGQTARAAEAGKTVTGSVAEN